ncbi:MAG: COX15/CtaA family protein [Gemmatimonadota bacterium]|nr:COX15/CtaA family protein [Gemmatimonadota bacterium]
MRGPVVRTSGARFARYGWGVLAFNLLVILWGAYVRASGSGAGCGAHWPLCNGVVIPRAPTTATLIELTHRATSGLALVLVVVLVVRARRLFVRGSPARTAAHVAMLLMLTEALVGAGLVLFEMVAQNESIARAYWLAAHLLNTFLLIGTLAVVPWFAGGRAAPRLARVGREGGLLLAPIAMQLLHLLTADLLWLSLVLLAAATLAEPVAATAPARSG